MAYDTHIVSALVAQTGALLSRATATCVLVCCD